ncbi:TonB-dependent siderophore receptor [Paracoccus sp. MKU1]|uniref:TonB-dependent receptor plug domain-containing protein n=1 Tax=Paracoccus sp. MKU1 TaxID=1745182 RepID=UPI0007194117|nr:TonB-dependent receptor [Paracoccus sp. MKU1]KRW93535.1 TonB-dependent receptor [Paracoccus sp. MKU1]
MFRTPVSMLVVAAALLPAVAMGQDNQQPVLLDPVILSGGLSPVAESAYGRAYTILTAEDLQQRRVTTVQDALRAVPGLAVTSTGETLTKVRIRGGEANHVLVLIDGVEANSPGSGDYIFSGMLAEDIERIEVLRGPQSTIYGANAASGVISITTRHASAPGLGYGGTVEIGGLDTRTASAFVQAQGERGDISLSAVARRTDGEDASRTPGGDTEFNRHDTLGLTGSYELTEAVTAGFTLRRTWQEYGYDKAVDPVDSPDDHVIDTPHTADRNETYGSLWIEAEALEGRLLSRFVVSGSNQATDHFNDGVPEYDDASRLRDFKFTGTWALDGGNARDAAQKLNVAVQKKRETYENSFAPGGRYERDTRSVALEYQGQFNGGIGMQAGLRRDFNDDFRNATTWSIAGAWQLPGRELRLRAAAGKAIVNPTMFELYGYAPGSYRGNPDLRPETSRSYEIGADWTFAAGRAALGATLFTSKVEDMIVGAGTTSQNIAGTSTRKGFEADLDYDATDWLRLGATYTYMDARTENDDPVPRQPRHQLGLHATADVAQGRGSVTADLRYVAGNYDQEWFRSWTPPTTELPDFMTVNLAAQYDLTENLRLTGRVVNLFDRDYSEAWGYYGQGRTFYAGLAAAW